ncbi:MAG: branched-chain amino acid ABC transporter permease [Desulfarculus sp.]|nr:branched-chain amino acid ABC transporter permease [Pseudomonadota bacterium]MBV1717976.1 branched-chain amino acid ABC transporter permease [Desulfarculus sp.]MBU4576267.1 branched-chain amino acid ABC transporter permease [Pseudomonadota bacterium]MBU4598037.1 branched-chain amino acid ABC transporter permease [Pseudomonadota bacterium]MBV1739410.1 branched-chain amino acid ABC transporter permease [Desulfarculus sp.]
MEELGIQILKSAVSGLIMGLVFALVALGLTVIFGVMDIVNFAHGEFLMVGMYTTLLTSPLLGVDPVLTLPLAGLVGAVLGVMCYFGLIRFLLRGPMIAQLFGTFGLMIFLRNLALLFMGSEPRIVHEGWLVGKSILVGPGVVLESTKVAAAALSLISFAVVWWFINRTRVGKAITATSLDAEGARYMGISTEYMNALAWAVGGASVGVAGGLLVNFWPVEPGVGLLFTMIAFATVALGGFGSVRGALVAGILIGFIVNLPPVWDAILRSIDAAGLRGLEIHSFKYTMVYAVYFLIMVLRPQGLFGWKQ